jgi:hypothetical protein
MDADKLIELITKELGVNHAITNKFIDTLITNVIPAFDKKQDVYTTDNITETGEIGLQTRIGDRLTEIKKYLSLDKDKREELLLTDQKITNNFLDIGVFGLIGYIYRNNNWKE